MINELSMLYDALSRNGIQMEEWSQDYSPMKSANKQNFCIRLILDNDHSARIEKVTTEQSAVIRKYGNNLGSFPVMNLRPLYRLVNNNDIKYVQRIANGLEKLDLKRINSVCVVSNWDDVKFKRKYATCIAFAEKLHEIVGSQDKWVSLEDMFACVRDFKQPEELQNIIHDAAWNLLQNYTDIPFALSVLFDNKNNPDDHGEMVVIVDYEELIEGDIPVVSSEFTKRINEALLNQERKAERQDGNAVTDAFGNVYDLSLDDVNPMPSATLAGGFNVKLRSMYGKQPCQYRYRIADDASYLISSNKRKQLKMAFEWIGSAENEGLKWIRVNKDERLFAYDAGNITLNQAGVFAPCTRSREEVFNKRTESFLHLFNNSKDIADCHTESFHIFMIRKTDKARTKVVYSKSSSQMEFQRRVELWIAGTKNVPSLYVKQTSMISPGDAAQILNTTWKQNGEIIKNECNVFKFYDGMDLFFGNRDLSRRCLNILIYNIEKIAATLSVANYSSSEEMNYGLLMWSVHRAIALIGVLLLQHNRRKENYMDDFAFTCGRLLKISDEIHFAYCRANRDDKMPSILIGGATYKQAINRPAQAIALLGQKMIPYIAWAKTYNKGDDVGLVKWLLNQYSEISGQIAAELHDNVTIKFGDVARAEMFLGYMAKIKNDNVNAQADKEGE